MMDLVIRKEFVVVALDLSEIHLIDRALQCLRYSDEPLNGSQLVNLAGLSSEWMRLCQDQAGKRYHYMRPKTALALVEGVDRMTHETN